MLKPANDAARRAMLRLSGRRERVDSHDASPRGVLVAHELALVTRLDSVVPVPGKRGDDLDGCPVRQFLDDAGDDLSRRARRRERNGE